MKQKRLFHLIILFLLAATLVAACGPAAAPAETQAAATQSPEVMTEAPAEAPAEALAATESAPVTEVAATAALTVPAETAAPSPLPDTGGEIPEGWLTYTDPEAGYSLTYPPEWEPCENTYQYSRLFCDKNPEPGGVGPLPKLVVSVYPQDYDQSDGQAYNYLSRDSVQGYIDLAEGERQPIAPDAFPIEYFTYTRLGDTTAAGQTAALIENEQVWEAPAELTDRRAVWMAGDKIYNVGTFYETPEDLQTFEQVLTSFQIEP